MGPAIEVLSTPVEKDNYNYIIIENQPVAPVSPFRPTGPVPPVLPTGPMGPVIPMNPVAPVRPVDPVIPTGPVAPVAPLDPTTPESHRGIDLVQRFPTFCMGRPEKKFHENDDPTY